MDLTVFAQECAERESGWSGSAIDSSFRPPSTEEQERDKFAAVLALESALAGGDLIVWTSGEAELMVVYEDGMARLVHYDLTSIGDLRAAIDHVTDLMIRRPSADLLVSMFPSEGRPGVG